MSRRSRPASFAEVADVLDQLPAIVVLARRAHRMNLRQAADASGVAFNTLSRVERGGECSVSNAKAILRWLDMEEV